jgi:serine/threonine protein kinase
MFCPRCLRSAADTALTRCPFDGAALLDAPRIESVKPVPSALDGEVLAGRYVIRGFLGKGGMSSVYLAEDQRSGEPVAVKILDRESAQKSRLRERFQREVKIAAAIDHPSVVRIEGTGERPDGSLYLVLEFLFGESLGELLRRDGALEPAFALRLIRAAASGLAAAHAAGIIHRDIKPDNLFLLGARGDCYGLKILDFGMAKLDEANLTAAGVAVGTLSYMAPEQALTDPVDARTDVYGLGVVLFQMLTGRLPFQPSERGLIVAQHLFAAPPRPSELCPGLDPRLEALVLRALRKHPDNRFPSMDALLAELDSLFVEPTGPLPASPLARDPDVYEPVSPFARAAAYSFEVRLGQKPAPPRLRKDR